jgi:diguanylate cyclase (GGDEF)-like protein/PAS domain S-box-containing protein
VAGDRAASTGNFPIRFLGIALAFTALVVLVLGWHTYHSFHAAQKMREQTFRLQHLQGLILYLDEALTMSARMAAATGELKWQERHHNFEPQLEAAIQQALALSPEHREVIVQMNEARQKLAAMEKLAYALIHQNRLQEARAILFSEEYEVQKQTYAKGAHLLGKTRSPDLLLQELPGLILYLDEVMTMSARMAAATGDLKWEERYRSFEPQLEGAIRQALALLPGSRQTIASIDEAHLKTVEMENLAFALVRQGNVEEASAVLFSEEHETQKQRYSEGLSRFTVLLTHQANAILSWEGKKAFLSIATVILVLPVLLFAWLAVLQTLRKWQESLLQINRDLAQQGERLAKVNEELAAEITERKRAEEALRKSEARFAGILDIAPEAIISVDRGQLIIVFNKGAERTFGYMQEEVIGQPIDILIPERFWTNHRNHIAAFANSTATAQRMGERGEIYGKRKSGEEFPAEASISKLELGGEKIFTVILRDITDRRRAKEELEKSFSLLHATLESTADGILVVDNDGKIVSSNQKFLSMWHLPKSVIDSGDDDQSLLLVLDQLKDPDSFLKKVKELYAQPDAESYDLLEFKDGRIFERYSQPQRIGGKTVGRVWSFRDISQRVQAERALAEQAIRDSLTHLYNRRYFEQRIEEEIARAHRTRQPLAILLCDLDHFKAINDAWGHQAGDEVLKMVARNIQEATRGADLVFRWGGDEFVVVLSDTTRDGVLVAADRIRTAIRAMSTRADLAPDLSIGIALYPEHGQTVDQLIRLADRALYIAKKGGDKIHIGEEEYRLDEQAIKVVFQPIVDVRANQTLGYEALSRDPQGKLSILELFKRYQAVGQLNELKTICFKSQLKAACEAKVERVFVNVDFHLLSKLQGVSKPTCMDVILEISELEAMHDVENHLKIARKWREAGYQFAIDDFGAGFISFPLVSQLIPDYIKLDRSTVAQAVSSAKFKNFTTDLVHALQNSVTAGIIAEGIETEKELQVIRKLGIHLVQGFLLGKPQELK